MIRATETEGNQIMKDDTTTKREELEQKDNGINRAHTNNNVGNKSTMIITISYMYNVPHPKPGGVNG